MHLLVFIYNIILKGKGVLDRKGTDKTLRKKERKKATFYCSSVSLNRRYLEEASVGNFVFPVPFTSF